MNRAQNFVVISCKKIKPYDLRCIIIQPSFPEDVVEDYRWGYGDNLTQGRNSSGTHESFLKVQLLLPVKIRIYGGRWV